MLADGKLLQSPVENDTIVVIQTSDKRLAKQLADHHLSLAQAYRQMAGMEPIPTGSQLRKENGNARSLLR